MIRKIFNRLKGRKKTGDTSLTFEEALILLGELNPEVRASINGKSLHLFFTNNVKPSDLVKFVEDEYNPCTIGLIPSHYVDCNHQIYSNQDEQHEYLDLSSGNISTRVGDRVFKNSSYKKCTIEWKTINKSIKGSD